jgi:hypothetical protein
MEEWSVVWWLVAVVAWTVIAVAGGLLLSAVTATADRRERAQRVPSSVPEEESLTLSR